MGETFQLTLPNVISSVSVREVAALTAFSMYPVGHSVNSVLELVKKTGNAIVYEEVLMMIDDVIRDIPSFTVALSLNGEVHNDFVFAFQVQIVFLRKFFRDGKIELRDRYGNTPIDQDATDEIIDEGMINMQDFKKFASQLDIVVSVEGEMKVVNSEATDKSLGNRERKNLLRVIAGLCTELGYDYKKTALTADLIVNLTDRVNASVGKTTIIGYLKEIPNVLETRVK